MWSSGSRLDLQASAVASHPEVVPLPQDTAAPPGEEILFVCTGNLCRSPIAAELLRSKLSCAAHVRVRSAGLVGRGRRPPRKAIRIMRRRGVDLAGHLSDSVLAPVATAPDLVLTMTRQQMCTLVELDGRLLCRTFTLPEFVTLAGVEGPRLPGEAIGDYLERVRCGRLSFPVLASRADDIPDPMGKRTSAYEQCARELDRLVEVLVDQLYPGQCVLSSEDRI
jgi:protein-tyrosine phosphatase